MSDPQFQQKRCDCCNFDPQEGQKFTAGGATDAGPNPNPGGAADAAPNPNPGGVVDAGPNPNPGGAMFANPDGALALLKVVFVSGAVEPPKKLSISPGIDDENVFCGKKALR
jgi:hypothetical protein